MGTRGFTALERTDMIASAMEMNARRVPIGEIAEAIGVSRQTIRTWLDREYQKRAEPNIKECYDRDMDLLESMIRLTVKRIVDGNGAASISDLDKLLNRRAKMLGYDKPIKLDVVAKSNLDVEVENLLKEMAEADASHHVPT